MNKIIKVIFHILRRLTGFFSIGLAFYLAIILITFNTNDPSFNTFSNNEQIKNFGGELGAKIADLSYQLIGLTSFIVVIFLFSIGLQMTSLAGVRFFLTKIILMPACLLIFSLIFAYIPKPSSWIFSSLGGVNGSYLMLHFIQFPSYMVLIPSVILALILFSVIAEVSLRDWVYFLRYSKAWIRYLFGKYVISNPRFFNLLKIKKSSPALSSNPSVPNVALPEEVSARIYNNEIVQELNDEDDEIKPNISNTESVDKLKNQLKNTKIKKPKRQSSAYLLPSTDLLMDRSKENKDKKIPKELVEKQSQMLLKVLDDFGVRGTSVGAKVGPVITLHEFEPEAGTKAARVISLADDIARSMSAVSARIAVVAGKTSIGIELPNPKREMIFLREMLESRDYKFSQFFLPMILGKDIGGEIMIADLAKMPHLLIAGTTGSGKSVGLNVMILSLLFRLRPDECKFIMIDPKMLELSIYDGIPHLLSPVVTEPGKAVIALKWVVAEMEERYRLMSSFAVRNIAGYNEKAEQALLSGQKLMRKVQTGYDPATGKPIIEEIEFEPKKLPFIVVIVDEMADLMLVAGKEIENSVQRLAQMARAAGIHLIMATQRPSVDVITGVIKANFPTRISFQVTSRIDSRTILGVQGAEQLLGQGDMIYMSGGSKMVRVHGPFCSDTEIENIVNYIKNQDLSEFESGETISFDVPLPNSSDGGEFEGDAMGGGGSSDEDLYHKAVMIVKRDKKPSISYVQRQLRIGYNRAATLIEKMEQNGVISPPNISGKREIIEE